VASGFLRGAGGARFAVAADGKRPLVARVKLHVLPAGPIQTNAYLLTAPERGEAVLIDAPGGIWAEIAPLLARENCRLAELWITHGHFDHMQGGAEVLRHAQPKVRAHPADRALLETPDVMKRFLGEWLELEPVRVDHWLAAGERFTALGAEVEVRHVPGHCPGSVLFYFAASKIAFVGDALFNGGVGRTDLPGGSFAQLERSIREQIYTLPDDTTVFPGQSLRERVAVGNVRRGRGARRRCCFRR
jgi:glyoxylase-like metal-dependent hydrolase (beta-lactamase superfamily II)